MTTPPAIDPNLRDRILSEPEVILEDQDVMRALVAANEKFMGGNIVDLRGIAMERLEARLDRLEDTHRSVIAAAYENMAGTNQIHRAVLAMMAAPRFEDLLAALAGDIQEILRVDAIRLVLESHSGKDDPAVAKVEDILCIVPAGSCTTYLAHGRSNGQRKVTLRQTGVEGSPFFGDTMADIRSEACLRLDLGEGRLPAMLAMGSEDPHMFTPQQGTDLLAFFTDSLELCLRRWLG